MEVALKMLQINIKLEFTIKLKEIAVGNLNRVLMVMDTIVNIKHSFCSSQNKFLGKTNDKNQVSPAMRNSDKMFVFNN